MNRAMLAFCLDAYSSLILRPPFFSGFCWSRPKVEVWKGTENGGGGGVSTKKRFVWAQQPTFFAGVKPSQQKGFTGVVPY